MTKTVYTYFPLKALGETVRLILSYGGEEFEDRRVSAEEWAALKPTTVFGQLPILEIDGKTLAQSIAISRYLGHKYGIAGNNVDEDFEIDQNIDFVNDIRSRAAPGFYEKDPQIKAQKRQEVWENYLVFALKRLDEIIEKNNGHIALRRLTWGDFLLASYIQYLKKMVDKPELDTLYPNLKRVYDNIYSIPRVKSYITTLRKHHTKYYVQSF